MVSWRKGQAWCKHAEAKTDLGSKLSQFWTSFWLRYLPKRSLTEGAVFGIMGATKKPDSYLITFLIVHWNETIPFKMHLNYWLFQWITAAITSHLRQVPAIGSWGLGPCSKAFQQLPLDFSFLQLCGCISVQQIPSPALPNQLFVFH